MPSVIHSSISMQSGNFDTSTWSLPIKIAFPFSTETVFSWYMGLLMILLFAETFIVVIMAILTYLTSCCLYIKALRDHFESIFRKIDLKIELDRTVSIKRTNTKTQSGFKELIIFHVKVAEWVLNSDIYKSYLDSHFFRFLSIFQLVADISSGTIFCQLVGNVIFVAGGIYYFERTVLHTGIGVLIAVFIIVMGLLWSFFLCYSASLSSDVIASIGDIAYNGNWIEYPIGYRKYIRLMIQRSECTAVFTGFKIFRCNLQTFVMVSTFIFSVEYRLHRQTLKSLLYYLYQATPVHDLLLYHFEEFIKVI